MLHIQPLPHVKNSRLSSHIGKEVIVFLSLGPWLEVILSGGVVVGVNCNLPRS